MNIVLIIITAMIYGISCYFLAKYMGRGKVTWFVIGLIIGLYALIILALLPNLRLVARHE